MHWSCLILSMQCLTRNAGLILQCLWNIGILGDKSWNCTTNPAGALAAKLLGVPMAAACLQGWLENRHWSTRGELLIFCSTEDKKMFNCIFRIPLGGKEERKTGCYYSLHLWAVNLKEIFFLSFHYEKFQVYAKFERRVYWISVYSLPRFNNYWLMANLIFFYLPNYIFFFWAIIPGINVCRELIRHYSRYSKYNNGKRI